MIGVTKAMLRLRPWVALIAGAIGCQSGGSPTELQVEPPADAAAAPVPTVHHRIVFTSDVLGLGRGHSGGLHHQGRRHRAHPAPSEGPLSHQRFLVTRRPPSHRVRGVHRSRLPGGGDQLGRDRVAIPRLLDRPHRRALLGAGGQAARIRRPGLRQPQGGIHRRSRLVTIASGCCLHPPAWHPGGNLIAYFQSYDSPRSPADDRGIWTVKPDGTGRTKILDVPDLLSDDYQSVRLSYSPDGTKLAFCHESLAFPYEPMPLEVLNADGSGRVVLDGRYCVNTDATLPEAMWKADGSRLLAKTNYTGTQWDLVSVAPDGSARTRLTTDRYASDSRKLPIAAWSRQGTMIAQVTQSGVTGAPPHVRRRHEQDRAERRGVHRPVVRWRRVGAVKSWRGVMITSPPAAREW